MHATLDGLVGMPQALSVTGAGTHVSPFVSDSSPPILLQQQQQQQQEAVMVAPL